MERVFDFNDNSKYIIESGIKRKEHFLEYCTNFNLFKEYIKLYEDIGTIQIKEGKDISNKIDNIIKDINQLYSDNQFSIKHFIKDKSKYNEYVEYPYITNIYELNYNNIFDWFLHLRILVVDNPLIKNINGASYVDDLELSCYTKNKILYGTILLMNPTNNKDLRGTIYHELRHYYKEFKIYQSNSHFIKNEFDLKQSYKYPNYNFLDYNKIIKNLTSDTGADDLEYIIFNCCYYLNQKEIESMQENIYSQLKNGKYDIINFYSNIYKTLLFLLNNNLECEHKILNNEILMKRIKKVFGIPPEIKKTSLKFVYKKFIKKYEYLMKHVNAMKEFLNIN